MQIKITLRHQNSIQQNVGKVGHAFMAPWNIKWYNHYETWCTGSTNKENQHTLRSTHSILGCKPKDSISCWRNTFSCMFTAGLSILAFLFVLLFLVYLFLLSFFFQEREREIIWEWEIRDVGRIWLKLGDWKYNHDIFYEEILDNTKLK